MIQSKGENDFRQQHLRITKLNDGVYWEEAYEKYERLTNKWRIGQKEYNNCRTVKFSVMYLAEKM